MYVKERVAEAALTLGSRRRMNVIRMEEQVLAGDRRMQDKMQECAALGRELDAARDEGSRAVLRANQRADAVRKSVPRPRRRQAQMN